MKKEGLSRRELLAAALSGIVVVLATDLPVWIEQLSDDQLFQQFKDLCTNSEYFDQDELLDLFEVSDDLQDALGYFYTVLLSKGVEPAEYLLIEEFILEERP